MMKKWKIVFTVGMALLLMAPAAFARLVTVGPINPANGFPRWYQDPNGVPMELTTPPRGTPITVPPSPTPISPTMVFDAFDPANAFSVQIGFGAEAFYWVTDAVFAGSTVGTVVYRAGLEASFGGGAALNGDQMVFSRIRCRIKGLVAGQEGTYTVKHPFGTEVIVVTTDDIASGKGLNLTRDVGLTPGNFAEALNGDVGPFLRQTAPISIANVPVGYPTTGWFGDGTTVSPVSGSPISFNAVSVTPPSTVNLGAGVGVPLVTSQFITSGHRFSGALATPLSGVSATYTRTLTENFVDVYATSSITAAVNAVIDPAALPIPMLRGSFPLTGNYFLHTPVVGPLPLTVSVTAKSGAQTATTHIATLTDMVTITKATFNNATKLLTVQAASSDAVGTPALKVTDPPFVRNNGFLTAGTYQIKILTGVAPKTVTVTSSAGGSATMAVAIVP